MTYKIIRQFRDEEKPNKVIYSGLDLEEAQEHCKREDTHKKDKNGDVIWFDGYEEE